MLVAVKEVRLDADYVGNFNYLNLSLSGSLDFQDFSPRRVYRMQISASLEDSEEQ